MKKFTILRLLLEYQVRGLYGSEIVAFSDGKISRGSVYSLLERLVDEGLVREVPVPPSPSYQLARTKHFITDKGQRLYRDELSEHREVLLSIDNLMAVPKR